MNAQEWRTKLSDVVKDWRLSPEAQDFYSLKVTPERAKLYMLQLSIYIQPAQLLAAGSGELPGDESKAAHLGT